MSWITIVWSAVASACLTLAMVHLLIWCKQTAQRAHLLFSVIAASVAAIAACELLAMRAQSPEQFGRVLWWAHFPVFCAVVSIVGFVRLYFHAGRPWLGYAACGVRLLALVINFFSVPNLNYKQITGLRHLGLFGGETISVAQGVSNPWIRLSELSSLLLLAFMVDASISLWRRGDRTERRRALVVGGSMAFFISAAAWHAALVNAGLIQSPYLISFAFLAIVGAMAYELSSDVARAARLTRRLQAREAALRESEQYMRLAADAAELVMWEWDIPRDEVWSSDVGRALFGFAPSEKLSFERGLQVVYPDDREAVRQAVTAALNGGGEYESEYRVVAPDGQVRWMTGRGRVEFQGGKPLRLRGVSLDITRRKQAEERFRLVVEAAPNAMVVVDAAGKVTLANAQVQAVFGYGPQELVGQPVEVLVPERLRARHASERNRYLAFPEARAMGAGRDLYGRRKDGSEVPVEIGLNPLRTPEGVFVLASIIDITERRQAELEAARQRDELAHLSRAMLLGELSGSLAHELNQPLTAILSNAQAVQLLLAQGAADGTELEEIVNDVVEDSKRATEVIRRLRLLLKKGEVQRQPLDVNEVVQNVLKLVRSDLARRRVVVETALTRPLPAVLGDGVQLQQVLLNLVVNGCDAMAGVEPVARRLLVRTELADGQGVRVSVGDQGGGIAPEKLERIFEPFFTTKGQGMGLGLAVCRTIISAHGGRLRATNNPGRGATVQFTLPLNVPGSA